MCVCMHSIPIKSRNNVIHLAYVFIIPKILNVRKLIDIRSSLRGPESIALILSHQIHKAHKYTINIYIEIMQYTIQCMYRDTTLCFRQKQTNERQAPNEFSLSVRPWIRWLRQYFHSIFCSSVVIRKRLTNWKMPEQEDVSASSSNLICWVDLWLSRIEWLMRLFPIVKLHHAVRTI